MQDFSLQISDDTCGICRKPIIILTDTPRHYEGLCYECEEKILRQRHKTGTLPGSGGKLKKRKKR
jgi:hypothetical protein